MTKKVIKIVNGMPTKEGDFEIHRAFPNNQVGFLDPFLMMDHFGPQLPDPNAHGGVRPHPHRGFETVTYIFSGEIEHEDSKGNKGKIGPGDVQWMTAAKGIVHSEEPSKEFKKSGKILNGLQLWVNLPAKLKMSEPKYQELKNADFPIIELTPEAKLKIISGEYNDTKGAAETFTPINYYHLSLEKGKISLDLKEGYTSLVFAIIGKSVVGGHELSENQLAILEDENSSIEIENTGDEKVDLLILNGEKIKEPIASYGPFVMNTQEEIYQAFEDYQAGKF